MVDDRTFCRRSVGCSDGRGARQALPLQQGAAEGILRRALRRHAPRSRDRLCAGAHRRQCSQPTALGCHSESQLRSTTAYGVYGRLLCAGARAAGQRARRRVRARAAAAADRVAAARCAVRQVQRSSLPREPPRAAACPLGLGLWKLSAAHCRAMFCAWSEGGAPTQRPSAAECSRSK